MIYLVASGTLALAWVAGMLASAMLNGFLHLFLLGSIGLALSGLIYRERRSQQAGR